MFVARRKLLVLFSILLTSVVLMTVTHYMYIDTSTKAMLHHQDLNSDKASETDRRKMLEVQRDSFRPGEDAIDVLGEDQTRPPELTVQEEVNKNLRSKRIEYFKKMEERQAADAAEEAAEMTRTTRRNVIKTEDLEDEIPDMNSAGTRYIPRRRVVHFDLKGAPPKLSYFKAIFPILKEAGATTLLMEYEDMFPFWGELKNISARNAYSKSDLNTILTLAKNSDLDVIPLVQTFGHMEFVLKLGEFRSVREVPYYPQAICPSQDRSWDIIQTMIDQMLSLHPDSRWIHVGCDEVYQLGQCPLCQKKIAEANANPKSKFYRDSKTLFLDHVHRVAAYARSKSVIPIIWDDMLRTIPEETIKFSGVGPLVEPMIWVYAEDVDRFVDPIVWTTYGNVFRHAWTASAFKGAFGERLFVANVARHVGNNLAWLETMRRESQAEHSQATGRVSFRGIAVTGWSRYDHFAVLCELLPVALPSLVLSLAVLKEGAHGSEAAKATHRLLQCSNLKALMTPEELLNNPEQWDLHRCKFPGSNLFSLLSSFDMTRREVELAHEKLTKKDGWMSAYNVRHRFSSVQRVQDAMRGVSYLPGQLRSLKSQLREVLMQYFDGHTAMEWLEQNVLPLEVMVEELNERFRVLTEESAWPRRPLDEV